jgi:hypothetical protein
MRFRNRAGNGTRTRDPNLGKVVLYQLSYSREKRGDRGRPADVMIWSGECRPPLRVEARGIEPLTS